MLNLDWDLLTNWDASSVNPAPKCCMLILTTFLNKKNSKQTNVFGLKYSFGEKCVSKIH